MRDSRLHLAIIAGEVSGDLMGARLVRALRFALDGRPLRLSGVGGAALGAEGLDSLFDMAELSLMGIGDVAMRLPRLMRRRRDLLSALNREPPDVIVGIDASGFFRSVSLALARHNHPAKRVLYKAPQAWAYWPWRAKRLAGLYDRVLAILPFEPAFYADYGVTAEFVGHPALDAGIEGADGPGLRRRLGIDPQQVVLTCLPGSRRSEVDRLTGIFARAIGELRAVHEDLAVIVPTVGPIAPRVRQMVADWPAPVHVVERDADRHAALVAGTAALTASGTAATELAIAGTPMVVAYRVDWATAAIARRVLRVPYATVANLVLDRGAVPEFIQERCSPGPIVEALSALIDDGPARRKQQADLAEAVRRLAGPRGSPSLAAAQAIIDVAV